MHDRRSLAFLAGLARRGVGGALEAVSRLLTVSLEGL